MCNVTCWILLLMACGVSPATGGEVSVVHAEYQRDHYQFQVDSRLHRRIRPTYTGTGPRGGHFLIHLHNGSDRPVRVKDVLLDGASLVAGLKSIPSPLGHRHPIYSLHFRDAALNPWPQRQTLLKLGEPIWYAFQPRLVNPRQFSQITIRTRQMPENPVDIVVQLDNGQLLKRRIRPVERNAWLTCIGLNATSDTIYAYLEKLPEAEVEIDEIHLDGQDIRQRAHMPGTGFYRHVLPIQISLLHPFEYGSRHQLDVATKQGDRIVELFRAWDDFYPIFIYGHGEHGMSDRERAITLTMELRQHHFNMNLGGGGGVLGASPKSLSIMKNANLRLLSGGTTRFFPFVPEAVWALDLQDEPDANDPQVVPPDYPVKVDHRIGFHAMYNVGLMEKHHQLAPDKPVWLQINHTGYPQNFFIYGRLADMHCHDPYHRSSPRQPKSLRRVYGQGMFAYLGGLPKPGHLTLLTTRRLDHQDPRWPFPGEIRIEAYYALATSIKGLSYWLYHNSGASASPPLLAEMGRVNLEVATAAPLLAKSQIIDEHVTSSTHAIGPVSVESDAEVFQQVLLSGAEALVVLLTNESYRPGDEKLDYDPLENVTIRVPKPPWLHVQSCFAISHDGVQALRFEESESGTKSRSSASNNDVRIDVGRLELTRMIVLGSQGVREKIERHYRQVIGRSVEDVAYAQRERVDLLRQYELTQNQRLRRGIVAQSSFEVDRDSDWVNGWVIRDGAWLDDGASRTGKIAIRCEGESKGMYSGSIDSQPGTEYRVRAYLKSEISEKGGGHIFIRYLNGQGQEFFRDSHSFDAPKNAWKSVETTFKTPDGTKRVQLFFGNRSAQGAVWYDDVTIEIKKNPR